MVYHVYNGKTMRNRLITLWMIFFGYPPFFSETTNMFPVWLKGHPENAVAKKQLPGFTCEWFLTSCGENM
jgi:hypothetical protein